MPVFLLDYGYMQSMAFCKGKAAPILAQKIFFSEYFRVHFLENPGGEGNIDVIE